MRVLVIVVIVVVIVVVTWESKANSSSSLTELQTGTELGNILNMYIKTSYCVDCPLKVLPPLSICSPLCLHPPQYSSHTQCLFPLFAISGVAKCGKGPKFS